MSANSRRARAAAEAAEWWVRIEAGELSREEREQFVDWLRESAMHVAEMLRMAEVHGALERFQNWIGVPTEEAAPRVATNVVAFDGARRAAEGAALGDARRAAEGAALGDARRPAEIAAAGDAPRATGAPVPDLLDHDAPRPSALATPYTPRRRWIAGVALAATVAALGIFLALFFSAQIIETGRAERRSVTLADGSVLQIDPESRLRIRLRKHERDVSLERGRALFRVAKDPTRPFIVSAEATQVRAVGTQFGVEQSRDGVVVTVAEGKVAVLSREPSGNPAATAAPSPTRPTTERDANAEVLLTAGQQVIVPRGGSAQSVRAVDTDRELAWVAGRLVFDNESVVDVVEEFNRYNVVQLHVANAELARRSVSGVFDASEPESFIGFMQSVAPVSVHRAGQDITIALAP